MGVPYWVTTTTDVAQELAAVLRGSKATSLHGSQIVGPEELQGHLDINLIVAHGDTSGGRRVVNDALRYRMKKGRVS